MTTHELNGKIVGVVPIEDVVSTWEYTVNQLGDTTFKYWTVNNKQQEIKLPRGFTFLSLASEMTEEKSKIIMPVKYGCRYEDYATTIPKGYFDRALPSFKSWCKENGLFIENKYPKPTCYCLTEYDREGCEEGCYLYINNQKLVQNLLIIVKEK